MQQLTGSDAEMLAVDGISVRLSGRDVLTDIRFAVRPGEFVGLIGSNGAGKTTLLRVILGLQQPTAGVIRVDGAERGRRGAARPAGGHRGPIGYVPQKVLLDPELPIRARDLVGLGLDGHRLGIPLPVPPPPRPGRRDAGRRRRRAVRRRTGGQPVRG